MNRGSYPRTARIADVSDDATKIIYLTDTTGFREYMLSVKDLATGKVLEDKLVKAASVTRSMADPYGSRPMRSASIS